MSALGWDYRELTKKLVEFQTFHPNFEEKRACLDFIKNLVKDDLHVEEFEFNGFPSLLLSTKNTSEVSPAGDSSEVKEVRLHFDLLLAGHIDVVSAPESMFTLAENDGKLFGRGVYDMKGAVAVMLVALQDYAQKKRGNPPAGLAGKNIGLLLTSDEELDGLNGTKAVLEKINLTADFALLPDNGQNWDIMVAERGLVHARVKPEENEQITQALSRHFPQRGNENTEWITTFSVENTPGVSGTDSPGVNIRVRFVSSEDKQKALKILNQTQIIREHNGFATPKDNRHLKLLQKLVENHSGALAVLAKECRTNESDAIYFAEHSIPAALVRPLGGGMHNQEEWLSKEALEKFVKILQTFLDEH